jgi:hypothetical protein
MLGHLDVDAGDDTWSLSIGDSEIASGGRYDRVSFTLSHGSLSSVTSENVMDLAGTHSSSFALAAFNGLVTAERLYQMTHESNLLEAETTFFHNLQMTTGLSQQSLDDHALADNSGSFSASVASHPMEYTAFSVVSAFLGVAAMMGVMRFISPSSFSTSVSYNPVMDDTEAGNGPVRVELEKPTQAFSKVGKCQL